MAEGGEVFLLDMGKPIKISDLAKAMIELSGSTVRDDENPDGEIEIIETGLRPGEKLYEELLIDASSVPTTHPRIVKAREHYRDWAELSAAFEALSVSLVNCEIDDAVRIIHDLVPGYSPRPPITHTALALNVAA